jgi:ribonuclease P/MRP protein subunit RPP40
MRLVQNREFHHASSTPLTGIKMWNFPKDTKHEQKCYVTHGTIGHVDPEQPPTKRKPFANILDHKFINKVEMILPKELYDIMEKEIFADSRSPVYSRVILPLEKLVEGDFFTEYIKKGNVVFQPMMAALVLNL